MGNKGLAGQSSLHSHPASRGFKLVSPDSRGLTMEAGGPEGSLPR